jgi:hypothetical protein
VERASSVPGVDREAIYVIEHADEHNADVTSPGDVQELWRATTDFPELPLALRPVLVGCGTNCSYSPSAAALPTPMAVRSGRRTVRP